MILTSALFIIKQTDIIMYTDYQYFNTIRGVKVTKSGFISHSRGWRDTDLYR